MNDVSDTHTVSLQNYAGLGHLLQAAGVSPDRAEAMVLGLLANPGQDLQIGGIAESGRKRTLSLSLAVLRA